MSENVCSFVFKPDCATTLRLSVSVWAFFRLSRAADGRCCFFFFHFYYYYFIYFLLFFFFGGGERGGGMQKICVFWLSHDTTIKSKRIVSLVLMFGTFYFNLTSIRILSWFSLTPPMPRVNHSSTWCIPTSGGLVGGHAAELEVQ